MEHPFSKFIQALGKGQRAARGLTEAEAEEALGLILAGAVRPEQIGAFLSLVRLKEETAEEVAGMVRALRHSLPAVTKASADLDWASYAGKRRQLPWYVLSALLLAEHGIRVLMHGLEQCDSGRRSVADALKALGVPLTHSLDEAADALAKTSFAFIPVASFSPQIMKLLALKQVLGLRSPIHTVARMSNPLNAPVSLAGIFHPGYDKIHQQAARLLGDPCFFVFKGEGGEAEINPDGATQLYWSKQGMAYQEVWPARFEKRHLRDESMDCARLYHVWVGSEESDYGVAAVVETAAVALFAMERAASVEEARALAGKWWEQRDRQRFIGPREDSALPGKVFLVGAGPGDPDLLTVKALRLMHQADVVVYDNLVSPGVLALLPPGVTCLYVGKQRGHHAVPQEGINELLVRLALEGKRVLRLKGGDPFIFGRGGEEIETLAAHGISFEVVPGITAASGIAAYAGIPLTHRDHAQSCVFVTGHLKNGTMDLDWGNLARPQQTLVVYMGLHGLEILCRELISHGLSPTTPAAIIQQGTTQRQRVMTGTLETLPAQVRTEPLQAPTLIIVGGVVGLHRTLHWFKRESNQSEA
ncbi:MAG: glycosyl transferase family protein [Ferrovum sp.]|jgi:uroporphyrin-III C-methyltransferase|nr:glycosyl transferase family protein [Ferrovum sp.]